MVTAPTTNQMSNPNITIVPCGIDDDGQSPIHHFIRIYTTVDYVASMFVDQLSLNALFFQRITDTNIYVYDHMTTYANHTISASTNVNAIFAVRIYTLSNME